MVTKRKTPQKARRRTPVRRAAPRRRAKSGITYIPGAMATAALVAVNANNIKGFAKSIANNGNAKISEYPNRLVTSGWVRGQAAKFIEVDNLVTSAVALAGGYLAGEVVKKYAPGVIKRPLGKIAKKIPKVI